MSSHESMASLLSLSDQIRYYDQRWTSFDYANRYCLERSVFILDAIHSTGVNRPRICDLGCGAGWLTGILSAFGPTLGVELSPRAVEQGRERYPNAQFTCADATQWQPPAEAFDIVVSQEVLEHIADKPVYLSVARRALRSGGYLVMTTPNLRVLSAIPEDERKRCWQTQPVELPVDRNQLRGLLNDAGFDVLRTSSAVWGAGRCGIHRLVNSAKFEVLLSRLGLKRHWQKALLNQDFGMYLLTLAKAR